MKLTKKFNLIEILKSIKELGVKGNKLHELMRKWMKEQGAKVIKLRNEGK